MNTLNLIERVFDAHRDDKGWEEGSFDLAVEAAQADDDDDEALSTGAVAGIAAGGVVVVAVGVAVALNPQWIGLRSGGFTRLPLL